MRIKVVNNGHRALSYGLGFNSIDRNIDGVWRDAVRDVFPEGPPALPDIGLSVAAGGRGGPRYGEIVDQVKLSRYLEPGLYRMVKEATVRGDANEQVRVTGRFVVRRAAPR